MCGSVSVPSALTLGPLGLIKRWEEPACRDGGGQTVMAATDTSFHIDQNAQMATDMTRNLVSFGLCQRRVGLISTKRTLHQEKFTLLIGR